MRVLLDTGPILAAANKNDTHHAACSKIISEPPGELLIPTTVLTEACLNLAKKPNGAEAEAGLLDMVAEGDLTLVELTPPDLERAADLVRRYATLPLEIVDASVVALAERLGVVTIATIDRRDFLIVRPRINTPTGTFSLIP